MKVKRSPEMFLVGFFLARCGRRTEANVSKPPQQLQTDQWKRAYAVFYSALGEGRTLHSFCNSLKNARDLFDPRVDSGRVGWRQTNSEREPLELTEQAQKVFDRWNTASNTELWNEVSVFADTAVANVSKTVLSDVLAERDPDEKEYKARNEGGREMLVSTRVKRDPRLRDDAIRLHGHACCVCGFEFGKVYGDWGKGYVEVHHCYPVGDASIGKRDTDPATDLIVLCANCHCMVHRKRDIVLSVDELRSHINPSAVKVWAANLKAIIPPCSP
jgi:hypothetical protein